MIHAEIAQVATAMKLTHNSNPKALPELVIHLAICLELSRRELLMHLWQLENGC